MLRLISTVIRKESQKEEIEGKKWLLESLVTCVPRHLQVVEANTLTGRPTVEARDTIVPSATRHLAKILI